MSFFLLRAAAPEDEHHAAGLLVDGFDHLVGERLPASSVMRIGFIPLHRERHVEQQDTLTCPALEVAVLGGPLPRSECSSL